MQIIYLLKRRTKEFALYQLIGLTRGNILRMLNIEQLVFFIVTGILGTLIGIFGSKLLLVIASKLMKLNTHISIGFEPQAILITIVMLAVAFFIDNDTKLHFLKKTQHFSFDERQLYPGSYPKTDNYV